MDPDPHQKERYGRILIPISIKVKGRIRIGIKVMRIRNTVGRFLKQHKLQKGQFYCFAMFRVPDLVHFGSGSGSSDH